MNLDIIKDDLVSDAYLTCLVDSDYLRAILKSYFNTFSEEELRKMHADAFEFDTTDELDDD